MDKFKTQPKASPVSLPPNADSKPPTAPQRESATDRVRREAAIARDLLIPAALSNIIGTKDVSASGVQAYLNGFYRDAGDPTDPVELILLEQLLLAHHRLALLHVRADRAESPEHQKILNTAATRLLGEVRRLALSVRQYRTPVSSKSFNVVHQQNVVAGGSGGQQVSYVDHSTQAQDKVSFAARTELGGNSATGGKSDPKSSREESPAGDRWSAERLETATVDH